MYISDVRDIEDQFMEQAFFDLLPPHLVLVRFNMGESGTHTEVRRGWPKE